MRTPTSSAFAPSPRMLQPGDRLIADANTGWLMHDAMRVVRAVRDVDVYIEQPCLSYEECLTVRRHCDHPFVLDEVIDSIDVLLARPCRPRHGCRQSQDQQARRLDQDASRPATCVFRSAWP